MFTKIADILTEEGFDVYSIGQHKGECIKPFISVKDYRINSSTSRVMGYQVVDVFPCYPIGRYTKATEFIDSVDQILSNALEPVHDGAPIIIDEDKKAYTTRLSYKIIKTRRK